MNVFCRECLILIAIMVVLVYMPGCGYNPVIPDNVQVLEFDSPSEYPAQLQKYQAYTILLSNGALVYTVKDNDCLLEHELLHCERGVPGHEGFPDYLMRCRI